MGVICRVVMLRDSVSPFSFSFDSHAGDFLPLAFHAFNLSITSSDMCISDTSDALQTQENNFVLGDKPLTFYRYMYRYIKFPRSESRRKRSLYLDSDILPGATTCRGVKRFPAGWWLRGRNPITFHSQIKSFVLTLRV